MGENADSFGKWSQELKQADLLAAIMDDPDFNDWLEKQYKHDKETVANFDDWKTGLTDEEMYEYIKDYPQLHVFMKKMFEQLGFLENPTKHIVSQKSRMTELIFYAPVNSKSGKDFIGALKRKKYDVGTDADYSKPSQRYAIIVRPKLDDVPEVRNLAMKYKIPASNPPASIFSIPPGPGVWGKIIKLTNLKDAKRAVRALNATWQGKDRDQRRTLRRIAILAGNKAKIMAANQRLSEEVRKQKSEIADAYLTWADAHKLSPNPVRDWLPSKTEVVLGALPMGLGLPTAAVHYAARRGGEMLFKPQSSSQGQTVVPPPAPNPPKRIDVEMVDVVVEEVKGLPAGWEYEIYDDFAGTYGGPAKYEGKMTEKQIMDLDTKDPPIHENVLTIVFRSGMPEFYNIPAGYKVRYRDTGESQDYHGWSNANPRSAVKTNPGEIQMEEKEKEKEKPQAAAPAAEPKKETPPAEEKDEYEEVEVAPYGLGRGKDGKVKQIYTDGEKYYKEKGT